MRLSNGLREFLESLNSRGIDYVIVGAHSLAFHVPVFILGKDALIRNKRAVGRPQDIADLDTLQS
jgi:hypothetical protein